MPPPPAPDAAPSPAEPRRDLLALGCNALVLGITLLGLLVGCVGWALVAVLSMRGTDGVHRDVPLLGAIAALPSLIAIALAALGIARSGRGLAARRESLLFAAAALLALVGPLVAITVWVKLQ